MGFFISTKKPMNSRNLPNKLQHIISGEKTDFIVKSSHQKSIKNIIPGLIFSIAFLGVLGFMISKFINPILEKKLLDTQNISKIENWKFLAIPAISFGILAVVGLGLLIKNFKLFFDKGTYFIGTEKGLIAYKNGNSSTKNWNEFTGKVTMDQKNNFGDLILELKNQKAGKIIVDEDIYEDNPDEEFYNESIKIAGIRNIMSIESKCKYRISQQKNLDADYDSLA